MIYSFTQISQYLSCPRRYRYRYIDGWKEKDNRANLLFGRAFEKAVAAYFRREDAQQTFLTEWTAAKATPIEFSRGETWERAVQEAFVLLDRLAQDDRIVIREPKRHLQVRVSKALSGLRQFVGYIDAVGWLDGTRTILEWKTTSSRLPDNPAELVSLDPQLICYSWLTGTPDVALVVFVRKSMPEIQYRRATITAEQRRDFQQLVQETVFRIESAHFPAQSGIRFPNNTCTTCPFVGLCLANASLIEQKIVRRPGGDLAWIDEIAC